MSETKVINLMGLCSDKSNIKQYGYILSRIFMLLLVCKSFEEPLRMINRTKIFIRVISSFRSNF